MGRLRRLGRRFRFLIFPLFFHLFLSLFLFSVELIKDLVEIEEIGHTPKKSRLRIFLNFSSKGKRASMGQIIL
ncbi:MAG: hypothetical protein C6I01_03780 [Epsilonproteobacteria bacterium]|nr:hypothetical protein [Campylobacterota bacterium]